MNELSEQPTDSYDKKNDIITDDDSSFYSKSAMQKKSKITPRERWHVAVGKIMMQLNVSIFLFDSIIIFKQIGEKALYIFFFSFKNEDEKFFKSKKCNFMTMIHSSKM